MSGFQKERKDLSGPNMFPVPWVKENHGVDGHALSASGQHAPAEAVCPEASHPPIL
jgi:hypothetical protein